MDDSMLIIDRPREKYLWETNLEIAEKIKAKVKQNSHEETNLPFISGDLTRYTVRLPGLTAARDSKWPDSLIDRHIEEKLEETGVVNWCRGLNALRPLIVPGQLFIFIISILFFICSAVKSNRCHCPVVLYKERN